MPYSNNQKDINVSYINKDFSSLKNSLIEYAKSYFPNTYRDFNETSPGMMLIEMSAYVGDVLSFYIDNQFKESMLPLSDERRNIINLAKTLGYKVKPSTTSFADLTFTQTVGTVTNEAGEISPDFSDAITLNEGIVISSNDNSDVNFETLSPIDFRVSSSLDIDPIPTGTDSDGLINEYTLTRTTRAMGGTRKTKSFTVGSPQKFLELKISDTNVIEIISVVDSNGNSWSEVEYLAQDKIRNDVFYSGSSSDNTDRSAYEKGISVPFLLDYKQVSKKFVTQTNEDNTTSIIFGNGLLKNGQNIGNEFLDLQQVGLTIPGETSNYTFGPNNIDIGLGDSQSTLGETPFNTTINVTYRVASGLKMNVTSNEISDIDTSTLSVDTTGKNLLCTNPKPAFGASENESIEEIRQKALAFFTTQNRCVTKEDYEARILNMPAKFGQISKVYVERGDDRTTPEEETDQNRVNVYVLSYDNNKNLKTIQDADNGTSHPLKRNLMNYLNNYKMLTDDIYIINGYVINFGVVFDVIAHRNQNKQAVKFECIQKIKDYFNIDKMQFKQVIYTSDLTLELSSVPGVRAVNFVELTQSFHLYNTNTGYNMLPLYCNDLTNTEIGICADNTAGASYGWFYNFKDFYNTDSSFYRGAGIVLPSTTPAVFELKNPNENIIGAVH